MRRLKTLIVVSALGLGFLSLGEPAAWQPIHAGRDEAGQKSKAVSAVSAAASPASEVAGVHIVLRHAGRRVAGVRAARVALSPDLRYAVLSPHVEGTVYQDGRASLRFQCDEIVIDRATDDLSLRGALQATSSGGDRVSAPEARWNARAQQLLFPRGIRLVTGDGTAEARRASARAGLDVVDLDGDVAVTFRLTGPPP